MYRHFEALPGGISLSSSSSLSESEEKASYTLSAIVDAV
ncbi:hypothetical protein PF003_g28289 [Phytophthora fragariae]|nr:hypothetical protein PF003_g28289 [Phytophthora fragariae]